MGYYKITKGKLKVYIDNIQVIDFSTLPTPGTGPTAFLIDDYDLLSGIKHFTQILQSTHNIKIEKQHIYSHLDCPNKGEQILRKLGQKELSSHLKNKTARSLNNICDKEASKHHSDI